MSQVRHVVRRLAHAPLFTTLSVLTLALGIGAATAIFSVLDGVLLRPLPYPAPDRLVRIAHTAPGIGLDDVEMSPSMYFTYRDEGRAFESVGVWSTGRATITGADQPEEVPVIVAAQGTLDALGVPPLLGRWFTRQDDSPGGADRVLLSFGYWQRRFGSDRGVLGRSLTVDGRPREVIGVLPREFRFLDEPFELILTQRFDRSKTVLGNFSYEGLARMKPGVTMAAASQDVARMIPDLWTQFAAPPGFSLAMFQKAQLAPLLEPLKQTVVGDIGSVLWVLMGTVGLVLLIACANVANLLLVRAQGRQQEFMIRAALGASWGRIARELPLEGIVLGLCGGAIGLGLAAGAIRLLVALPPTGLPRLNEIAISPVVVAFALVVSVISGLMFGLVPVFKYVRPNVAAALRAGGRSTTLGRERHRAQGALVVGQLALALVLLVSAGLLIRTFQALRQVDPGFSRPDTVQTLRVSIPEAEAQEPERVVQMQREMLEALAHLPGVTSAGLSNAVVMDGTQSADVAFIEHQTYAEGQLPPVRRFRFVGPGYFATIGQPIIAGRDLTWTDLETLAPVALVSDRMARAAWGSPEAALGKRVRESASAPWHDVIGVAGDERANGVAAPPPTMIYWPMAVRDFWGTPVMVRRAAVFTLRTDRSGSEAFLNEVRHAVWTVNPNLPVADVRTLGTLYRRSMARTSFTLVMLGIASAMAVLLGVIGLYGVIAHAVSQRTREIGVRLALGAQRADVTGLFVRRGLWLAAGGVVIGSVAAAVLTRFLAGLLFQVRPVDPVTYVIVAAGLVAVAVLATYVPAHRATTVDPADVLRAE